jgi:hypothetical protein
MRFVDCDKGNLHFGNSGQEYIGFESFGRHVQKLGIAIDCIVECNVDLASVHGRIDRCSFDAPLFEILNLVLHQSDQGGNYEADSRKVHGRHLEANGLAATGGEQGYGIVAIDHRLDYAVLNGSE